MKIQLSQIKSCASVTLVSIGVTALLSTVCAYSSYIPAGEVSYQWLWCGWASLVFFTCALLANLLSVKGVHCFHHSVIWGLILMGGIESVWGLRQIYGFATSNHSLYAVTGSFFNPGPYSGYLALVFPVCLNEWLRLSAVKRRTWIEWAGYYFSSYPMAYPCFFIALILLLVSCFLKYSRKLMLLLAFAIGAAGVWLVRHTTYDACREWSQCKMLYGVQAYGKAKEEYGRLYPLLKNRPRFIFEYGRCLHKLKEYDASNRILQEAERISCDPMILNVIGKNYQALKKYKEAEHWLLRSTHRLPGRIYPYYLLAKLYAEPAFREPDKLKQMAEIVLTKEPKVLSPAIREMRNEVKKLLSQ